MISKSNPHPKIMSFKCVMPLSKILYLTIHKNILMSNQTHINFVPTMCKTLNLILVLALFYCLTSVIVIATSLL